MRKKMKPFNLRKTASVVGVDLTPTGYDGRKLKNKGVVSPTGVSVKVDNRTTILVNVPEGLSEEERAEFIAMRVQRYKQRLEVKIHTFNPKEI